MMKKTVTIGILCLICLISVIQSAKALEPSENAAHVKVGVWLVNVEKVDLSSNSYRLDFYLWFKFDPNEISLNDVKSFEFINGAPTKYEVSADGDTGYLEYRVRGDFITAFDFSDYQFEKHSISVKIEHTKLDATKMIFETDSTSDIDPEATIAGWNLRGFKTEVSQHSYSNEAFSRFIFSVDLERPLLSSFIKSVLPIAVITTISLLAFFISPQNFAQRITLGVTTLMSATTFHLSLISGIPPTGYLTFADRMMISIYVIFLYNLGTSVYIMRLVDGKKIDKAISTNRTALRILPVLILILLVTQVIL
ncbi:MAG: hypothetical protein N3D85_06765 [Candidatus Bathyarchaeota archaeon]|nr:hypothetical protein [Candidatus Bathyarchaeota archaeon]